MLRKPPLPSRSFVTVSLFALAWLALIDIAVNLAFGPAPEPGQQPSALSRYFEYGRSIEGKLERMVADPKGAGLILSAGWVDPTSLKALPDRPQQGANLLVGVYGQSFTFNAANDAVKMDGHITLRGVGGPAAPPNHSYAAYKADAPLRRVDAVLFGVLSSSVAHVSSMSGLFWMFENPAPFTFPRYRLADGRLSEELPLIRSEAAFKEAFTQRSTLWRDFTTQLKHSDRGYDPFSFETSIADASSIIRLVRRGWVAHSQAYDAGVYTPGLGFNAEAEEVRVLQAMVEDLGRRTRERGERLIVLLLHARGHSDHLYEVLKETLSRNGIDHISTHTLFSANDPANFVPDGHYAADANRLLARTLHEKLRNTSSPLPATSQNTPRSRP